MSASDTLAGLSLDDILGNQKRPHAAPPPPQQQLPKSRTLLDIIREDETNKKDRRSWKAFKDKLRLKRAGSAWTSSIHIPTSDIPVPHPNSRSFSQYGRRNSVRHQTHPDSDTSTQYMAHQVEDLDPTEDSDSPATAPATRPQFTRGSSTRYRSPLDTPFAGDSSDNVPAGGVLRPQLSRRNSTTLQTEPFRRGRVVTFRDSFDDDEPDDGSRLPETGRALSAREAVAAQEAAEAAAAAEAEEAGEAPVMMSLMDLLEETDREMGLEGSRYILSDDEDFDEEEGGEAEEEGEGVMEYTCCVCMVRHKAAAFIPCGHTFCRMCSRELMVSRGNCPLCNNFILEILDIF
ncbi:uncharacterized protein LOC133314198 isoform X2 [Gastrolobium bilobum]|nr:uncharacterized protein LOC133314198 isoform X2 [Gastrolobium bilobum]